MPEVKHGGCFDCGSEEQEILKSVTCTREVPNPKKPDKPSRQTGSFALCDPCLAREEAGKKG